MSNSFKTYKEEVSPNVHADGTRLVRYFACNGKEHAIHHYHLVCDEDGDNVSNGEPREIYPNGDCDGSCGDIEMGGFLMDDRDEKYMRFGGFNNVTSGEYIVRISDNILDPKDWGEKKIRILHNKVISCSNHKDGIYKIPDMEGWSIEQLIDWLNCDPADRHGLCNEIKAY